jgi:hypothetical protein
LYILVITAREKHMENYGNGETTGLEQTAAFKINTGLTPEHVSMSKEDGEVLKRLAARVAEISASDRMEDIRKEWTRHNKLEAGRPIVLCDPENGWNEIITEKQMQCSGVLARRWEMDLRKEIFWGEEMGDDKPVEPFFDVPYTVSPDDWGVAAEYHKTDSQGSYVWDAPIQDYERDLSRLHAPEFEIDYETTNGCLDIAKDLFEGTLHVRLKGTWWWSLGLTWPAATFRGLEAMFFDFIDHPDGVRELMSILSGGFLKKLDYLQGEGLLSLNNDGTYVGSGGYGFTDELPRKDFNGTVRTVDMWGFTESQETVNVSPDMYGEFIFPYEKPIMERFGLTCYGCCEPVHPRWHVVKQHPGLRRVSCSPWADTEKMAENLQDNYIYSMKPAPAAIAEPEPGWNSIRSDLQRKLEITRGCRVEVIMKDNHTIGGRPENVVQWCRIAREEARRIAP